MKYIPAGRTSLVKRGPTALQLQTEYAHRPSPRITTTILENGQVIHKIDRQLDKVVDSIEAQNEAADRIKQQHLAVIEMLKQQPVNVLPSELTVDRPDPAPLSTGPLPIASSEEMEAVLTAKAVKVATEDTMPPTRVSRKPIDEALRAVAGAQSVFPLSLDGSPLEAAQMTGALRALFGPIVDDLSDLVTVFADVPGKERRKETGVYEIERDRLYLVSPGDVLYLVLIYPVDLTTSYESVLRETLRLSLLPPGTPDLSRPAK